MNPVRHLAGLLNTCYYTATFAFVWLAVAKVPRGLGLAATAQRFVTVMAAVWAGSQVSEVWWGACAEEPAVERRKEYAKGVDRGV